MVVAIREQAAREIRKGQRLGVLASIGLGLLVFVAAFVLQPGEPDPVAATPVPAAPAVTTVATPDETGPGPAAPGKPRRRHPASPTRRPARPTRPCASWRRSPN